jgi:hypothetical protein
MHFTVYGRAWCHLCDDMLAALRTTQGAESWDIAWVDIDVDGAVSNELAQRYDELVPVLVGRPGNGAAEGSAQEICHYFLDRQALAAFLATAQG